MSGQVSFDEFSRIDFRVGRVAGAERVPGSKKLVKLQIDLGTETKQSVAGLGDQYSPEELAGRLVIVVTNLKPRQIFGLASEVMLLAAVEGERVSLLTPDREVAPGTKVM
jgi:methionyl-tRNA synthetase